MTTARKQKISFWLKWLLYNSRHYWQLYNQCKKVFSDKWEIKCSISLKQMVASNMSLILKCCTRGVLVTPYIGTYEMPCKRCAHTFVEVSKRNGHLAYFWPTKPMYQGIEASPLQTGEIYLLPEINMVFVLGLSSGWALTFPSCY